MTRAVLVIGRPDDPLVRAVSRRVSLPLLYVSPQEFPASFEVGDGGGVAAGAFIVDGRSHGWDDLAALWVRPGRAWSAAGRTDAFVESLVFHERRAAWCALLEAFGGTVIDRLPPAWFVDPVLHRAGLADSFAAATGCDADRASRAGSAEPGTRAAAAYVLAGETIAAGPAAGDSADWAEWLSRRSAAVRRWQSAARTQVARIDARRVGERWTVATVDPLPSLIGTRRATIDAHCGSLAALFG